jgi:hypothetical protein
MATLENSYGPEALVPTPIASPPPAKAQLNNGYDAPQYDQGCPAGRQKTSAFSLLSFIVGFAAAAILVGGGVGGGLGASLANCHKSLKYVADRQAKI